MPQFHRLSFHRTRLVFLSEGGEQRSMATATIATKVLNRARTRAVLAGVARLYRERGLTQNRSGHKAGGDGASPWRQNPFLTGGGRIRARGLSCGGPTATISRVTYAETPCDPATCYSTTLRCVCTPGYAAADARGNNFPHLSAFTSRLLTASGGHLTATIRRRSR